MCKSSPDVCAVLGAGVPEEEHTASATGCAELHAPLQIAQTDAPAQGMQCLACTPKLQHPHPAIA